MNRDAVIIDMDGTLCDVSSIRYLLEPPGRDFERFHTESAGCPPIADVVEAVKTYHHQGMELVIVTARMYRHEKLTRDWLGRHLPVPYTGLFMRGDTDYRPDYEVKRDIHRILVNDHGLRPVHAFDDNPAVIALWEELGIPATAVPGWPDGR